MIFVTYDPDQGFPQDALLGRGTVERTTTRNEDGEIVVTETHTPPDGLGSFVVEDTALAHGIDARFYTVIDGPALEAKTQSEVDAILAEAEQAAQEERQDALLRGKAEKAAVDQTIRSLVQSADLTDAEKRDLIGAYPRWTVPEDVEVGMLRRHEGALYECIQSHTTQSDWSPPTTASLWAEVVPPGTIGAWVQPSGAHDAYALGAIVTHNSETWISTVEDNVWEPGVFGWDVYQG